MSDLDKYVEFEIEIIHQTQTAVLLAFENDESEYWVPWKCIEDNKEDIRIGYKGKIYVAKWFVQSEWNE